jgi:hypothetical protein
MRESPRWHLVVRVGDADSFTPATARRDQVLTLILDGSTIAPHVLGGRVTHNVWSSIDERRLVAPPTAVDLFRLASAVYAADARVKRRSAYDGWTREFVLHMPVTQPAVWDGAVEPLIDLLGFLTGDQWQLHFRPLTLATGSTVTGRPTVDPRGAQKSRPLVADAVCLLSGGLDSFAGAVNELAKGGASSRRIVFASHNTAGSERFTSSSQDGVVTALANGFGGNTFEHLKFRVVPPSGTTLPREDTQRSRSIIFLALGAVVGAALNEQTGRTETPLIVPENGFISLNVPLTPSRLGTCSTRTTHPYAMSAFARVLSAIGIGVPLELPYRWHTKGEMLEALRQSPVSNVMVAGASLTNSCARPNDRNADVTRPQRHCGYCVPCLIRRAAMAVVGLDSASDYRIDVHAERGLLDSSPILRSDVRAFELAIETAETEGVGIGDVLSAGPLPDNFAELDSYVGVHRRGLNEVAKFLLGRPLNR